MSTTIQITFSSAANPVTVNTTNIQVADPKQVAGTVSYNATTNTATFTPSAALVPNTTFTVNVTGVSSSAGTAMAGPFTSTFTTAPTISTGPSPTLQYQATLFPTAAGTGQVSVDTSGNVTVQLAGATASTTYAVQFCPAVNDSDGVTAPACISAGSVNTDASGSGSSTTMFPQAGSWAGDFQLNSGTKIEYMTGLTVSGDPGYSSQVYMSTLQPESTTNGKGVVTTAAPQNPLTSGAVTYSKGSLVFSVTGATPDTAYTTVQSETVYLDGSGSYALSELTTDASGNGSSTAPVSGGSGGDLFAVLSNSGAGFIGGFSVPK
jgi:Bacterial Ig-like domain